ncbi:MAG: glycosyltransferase 87 family protein [Phycisphaerales bacterium]
MIACLPALAALVWALAVMEVSRDPAAASDNLPSLNRFWIASAACWSTLTALAFLLTREPEHTQHGGRTILVVALVARVLIVATHDPGLSDDLWRYLFDGRAVATGHNPYHTAPIEIDSGQPRFPGEAELASRLNYPELVTIYLPTSQLVFGAIARVGLGAGLSIDSSATLFRGVFALFDLLVVVVLLRVLRRRGKSPWWAALYAWNPLVLTEIAGSGHQDILGVLVMVIALGIVDQRRDATVRWSTVFAVGALVKPIPVALAGFAARGVSLRRLLTGVAAGMGVAGLIMAPFALDGGVEAWNRWRETLGEFVDRWAFNGSIYPLILASLNDHDLAKWITALLLTGVFVILRIRRVSVWTASRAFLFAALLLSTTAHPWYLLWSLCLIPIAFEPAVWIASLTLPWAYIVLNDVDGWTVPTWTPWIIYAPIYLALGWSVWRSWSASRVDSTE